MCCVVDDLVDSTVSPVVPGVVSEVIDELHRRCVSSPRAQQKDALLCTALEVVDEMVQEIMEEEVWATLGGGGEGVVLVECSQAYCLACTYVHTYVPDKVYIRTYVCISTVIKYNCV